MFRTTHGKEMGGGGGGGGEGNNGSEPDQHQRPPGGMGMDQWLLTMTSDPAANRLAKDLEVAGAVPVHCHFSLPLSFLTMCSSKRCPSFMSPWYIDHLNYFFLGNLHHSLYTHDPMQNQ